MASNSNNTRKNYLKYSLPNPSAGQHVMNVKTEEKPKLATIPIMFKEEDEEGVKFPDSDTLMVTLEIGSSSVSKVLVDIKSSVDIILKDTLDSFNIENLKMGLVKTTLYGFTDSYILPLGFVQPPLTMRDRPY